MAERSETSSQAGPAPGSTIEYRQYRGYDDMDTVMGLIDPELSEPYSIFTYRYFLTSWPHLCYLALEGGRCCGTVVAKLERHREALMRGYIAMLVVQEDKRGHGVGTQLVLRVIKTLIEHGCEEVVLEAEVTNIGALRLYERLGFIRDKRLKRYYLNGSDAFRLKLLLQTAPQNEGQMGALTIQDEGTNRSVPITA